VIRVPSLPAGGRTPEAATSAERLYGGPHGRRHDALFDYKRPACGGAVPAMFTAPGRPVGYKASAVWHGGGMALAHSRFGKPPWKTLPSRRGV